MNLQTVTQQLLPKQITRLCSILLEASTLYELEGDWKLYLKKEKNKAIGRMRKILEIVEALPPGKFKTVAKNISEVTKQKKGRKKQL